MHAADQDPGNFLTSLLYLEHYAPLMILLKKIGLMYCHTMWNWYDGLFFSVKRVIMYSTAAPLSVRFRIKKIKSQSGNIPSDGGFPYTRQQCAL